MQFYSPSDIKNFLFKRFKDSEKLIDSLKKNGIDNYDLDSSNMIFMKYYFDFSSAIETLNRNIIKTKFNDQFVQMNSKIDNERRSFFLDYPLEKCLIDVNESYTIDDIRIFYENRIKIVEDNYYLNISLSRKISNYKSFEECYKKTKKTRNYIAHSLTLPGVDFNKDTLFQFMIVFYIIFKYYESIY